ncbi:MAG: SCO family protein [Pseudomonadota bacterium]
MTPAKIISGAAVTSILAALWLVGLPERIEAPEKPEEPVSQAPAPAQMAETSPPLPSPPGLPFPIDIEVAFELTDHFGNAVTAESYRGRPMFLFFGFASCESICTVALPRMGQALEILGSAGDDIEALMITVDPERDTPMALRQNLNRWHDRLIGLTGNEDDLAAVRNRFQVDVKIVAEDPTGGPIYAHGSFIYLIGADGELKTMIPPILGPEKIASLAQKYF